MFAGNVFIGKNLNKMLGNPTRIYGVTLSYSNVKCFSFSDIGTCDDTPYMFNMAFSALKKIPF